MALTDNADWAGSELPTFVCIARAIAQDIQRGRLPAGSLLPSSRVLSAELGVHRNTVLAAYRELSQEGWIESQPGRGTFVARSLAHPTPGCHGLGEASDHGAQPPRQARCGFELRGQDVSWPGLDPGDRDRLLMYGGMADLRLLPTAALSRAYRRALRRPAHLGYGDAAGCPELRVELAQMLRATRGLNVSASDVVITRGSQMGLALSARAVLAPGDRVAVEAYGYPPMWEALRQSGIEPVPVPVDAQGLDTDALARLCDRQDIRGVYVTPHHQYPTTTQLSASRRIALRSIAERFGLVIFEDDYDHEYQYEGQPRLPLASTDRAGHVVYIGTFSKVLAPGLRIGYVAAPPPVKKRLVGLRAYLDRQGDHLGEAAVAELMADGELQRHLWRTRRIYQSRRDHCARQLRRRFGDDLSFATPAGGMAIWAQVKARVEIASWLGAAHRAGVSFQDGSTATFGRRQTPFVRLGFAALDEGELTVAVQRLKYAFDEIQSANY